MKNTMNIISDKLPSKIEIPEIKTPDIKLTKRLAYIREENEYTTLRKLYFVSDFDTISGDDWDDVPYEHNSSEPYSKSEMTTIIVEDENMSYKTPRTGHINSFFSVDDINSRKIAWMSGPQFSIFGGETYLEVINKLHKDKNLKVYK